MSSVASELGLPGNRSFATMYEFRLASLPIVIEYLSISKFSHDCSLVRYLSSFPGSLWPQLTSEPKTVLYILWSPLHDKIYAGRTIGFERRHLDHCHRIHCQNAPGQIPAYHALREHVSHDLLPVASFFMLPVVAVEGMTPESVVAERVFLGNFSFKLNTPHVYKHFPASFPHRRNIGGATSLHTNRHAHGRNERTLARHARTKHKHKAALTIPAKPKVNSTIGRILAALCFNRRDRAAKHGLKLLFLVKSRATIIHIFHQVHRWTTSSQRIHALKFVRIRARQLQIQLPVHKLSIALPWCGSQANIAGTMKSIQDFATGLFSMGACQPSVFDNGRVRCQLRWEPAHTIIDIIRTAPIYNRHIDDAYFCACSCHEFAELGWPMLQALDGTHHVCARQSEIPWPPALRFFTNMSVHAHVLPKPCKMAEMIANGFVHMAEKLKDPFSSNISSDQIRAFSLEHSRELLKYWNLGSNSEKEYIPATMAAEIKKLCHGLFIETLDKNTSEFVCMCPRMYHLMACGLFQYYIPGIFLIGASYRAISPFHIHCRRRGAECVVRSNDVLKLSAIHGDTLCFGSLETTKHVVSDFLVPEPGKNFSYDSEARLWHDGADLHIPHLQHRLQPLVINKQFSRLWKRKLGSRQESWGTVRAIPKQKNLSLGRPLGDQSCNPLSLLSRILARFLDLCLQSLPEQWHFDRSTHGAVIRSLLHFRERPFTDGEPLSRLVNYGLFIVSRDVDNGYMRIQHTEAVKAWLFIKSIVTSHKRCTAWVSPFSAGSASWHQQSGRQWVKVNCDDIEPILTFMFQHMQFSFGKSRGWQTEGIMMGQAAGGAIFRMVLVAHEIKAMTSPTWSEYLETYHECRFFAIRFVDDLRVFVLYPLCFGDRWASSRVHEFFQFVYPSHLIMKEDSVNPFVGLKLFPESQTIHWGAFYKPLGEAKEYRSRYLQNLLPWNSFSPSATFTAVLLGGFARCKQLSSNVTALTRSLANFILVMGMAGYPQDFIRATLRSWCRKQNLQISEDACFETPFGQDRLLNMSFTEAEITLPVGRLSMPQL